MRTDHLYRAFRCAVVFMSGAFTMACAEKEIDIPDPDPDPKPTEEQVATQLEKDRSSIIDMVSSCISDDFNAEALLKEKLEIVKKMPSVKTAEVTSGGLHLQYVDDSEESILFDYGTAFDDETTDTNGISYSPPTYTAPTETRAQYFEKIHIFNLFTEDSGRKYQNQLMRSAVNELRSTHAQIIEHPFADFTVDNLIAALSDPDCIAIFISTIGDYGQIAVGGNYYKTSSDGSPYYGYLQKFCTKLTPVGNSKLGNTVNQLVGHSYNGVDLNYIISSINDSLLAGKMVYLSSCHTLQADFMSKNVCIVGWDNVNMLGEAYALIMANYMGRHGKTLGSFQANFKNSAGGIEDKYAKCGAILRVKGAVKDFSLLSKEFGFAPLFTEPERKNLLPHKIQITSPENGGCVNPFAFPYSVRTGGCEMIFFDYLLDSGESVSIWHNTNPQGRVYYIHTQDFIESDWYSMPIGMYKQSILNPCVVPTFYSPGVMRLEFYSQNESDYKDKGPSDESHKLEDAIYVIAPHNYQKNDPVQNHDPSITTLTVLRIDDKMYAYGGVLNMDGNKLTKCFKLSKKGESGSIQEIPATNDANLFYAPLPNMKKGTEYTVIAYATDENGTIYMGEPYDFVSEVDTAIPTEPTQGDLIDLGLSVKWASCNIGATEPQDVGGFYAWGETQTKSTYYWSNYNWCESSESSLTKYCTQSSYGTVDNKTVLDSADDVAYSTSGGKLRMPTSAEWQELIDRCQWTKINYKGQDGYLVASPVTGNAIFIPCNGFKTKSNYYNFYAPYYWSSDLRTDLPTDALKMAYLVSCEIDGHERFEGLGVRPVANLNENDVPESETITVNGVSFKMIKVEGGAFMMGSPNSDREANPDEKPQHQVILSTYYIGQTEVTQALWEAVMGSNPSANRGADNPVEYVSRNDMNVFISKLNQLTGKHFRLPTEAEWEFAARGGNKSQGYKYPGSDDAGEVAWYDKNSNGATHPVAQKKANELGLFDMAGNVWEPCMDYYDADYYSISPVNNPCNTTVSSVRVMRGGGLGNVRWFCRIAMRADQVYLDDQSNMDSNWDMGLRLVLSDLFQVDPYQVVVPEAVDLGLSVKWGSFNLGATKPEEPGDYYAWGDTEPYYEPGYAQSTDPVWKSGKEEGYWDSSYKWGKNQYDSGYDGPVFKYTKYCTTPNTGYDGLYDNKRVLDPEDDAAHVHLGGKWRMPTVAERNELYEKCTWKWTSVNGIDGYQVYGPNGNSIFLPIAGYRHDSVFVTTVGHYWTSSLEPKYSDATGFSFGFHDESTNVWDREHRIYGLTIRPVYDD